MKIIDSYNALAGAIVAVLSYIFGAHWILFVMFLLFNVLDWIQKAQRLRFLDQLSGKY